MTPLEAIEVSCPYCGQQYEAIVDCSAGDREYVEDCEVCCRPVVFMLRVDVAGGFSGIEVRREDE